MPQPGRNRSLILRVIGATLFAAVLWTIVSLSGQFDTMLDVPLSVETPADQALVETIPQSIRVRVRASGWNLLKILATGRVECVLRPLVQVKGNEVAVGYGRRELLASIRTNIPETQQLSVAPDTLTLMLGPIERKSVAVAPEATITTRKGFQVIGGLRVSPDTIMLVGSRRVLADISSWPTERLELDDVHRPVARTVALSDTLRGIIAPLSRRVDVFADVQEVGERVFTDIPILNRGMMRDTALSLVLHPSRVQVMLRGGARDLSRIESGMLRAYVQVIPGSDTLGVAFPRILLPPGINVTVVSIKPSRIRYVFRREL